MMIALLLYVIIAPGWEPPFWFGWYGGTMVRLVRALRGRIKTPHRTGLLRGTLRARSPPAGPDLGDLVVAAALLVVVVADQAVEAVAGVRLNFGRVVASENNRGTK